MIKSSILNTKQQNLGVRIETNQELLGNVRFLQTETTRPYLRTEDSQLIGIEECPSSLN